MAALEGPGVRLVDNETSNSATRASKEGKSYTYKLNVIQQPERARACGSGAKSSADRRPVDPPPIVELKIFEGNPTDGELKDVTFSMNCSYFLFATLEQARHVARGRVSQEEKRPTVLTGTPVAGMVYLDRPSPAGYFIFPDLSVRHEGKYRLSFNLYEETKDAKDGDRMDSEKLGGWGNGCVTHRLDVSSQPFTVFSAKKFPGLTESTSLSRIVAEQGCRVRIRRDVRMRRRDNKSSKDWDGYEDETSDLRNRVSATPEATGYNGHSYMDPIQRPRSGSNASHPSLAPSLSRRTSLQDISQPYHSSYGPPAPHTPQSSYPQSSPYVAGPSPSHAYGPPAFVQQQSSMQPPPISYHQQTHQPPPPLPPAPAHQTYYGYAPASSPAFDGPVHSQRHSIEYSPQVAPDHRRSSVLYAPTPQTLPQPSIAQMQGSSFYQSQAGAPAYQQSNGYHSTYSGQHGHQSSLGSSDGYRPIPAEPIQPPTRTTGAHTPLSSRSFNDKLPPINTTFNVTAGKAIEPMSPGPAPQYSSSHIAESSKRQYSQVFNDRHQDRPLRQGARPSPASYNSHSLHPMYPAVDEDPLQEPDIDRNTVMVYRRADGRQVNRNLPPRD